MIGWIHIEKAILNFLKDFQMTVAVLRLSFVVLTFAICWLLTFGLLTFAVLFDSHFANFAVDLKKNNENGASSACRMQ